VNGRFSIFRVDASSILTPTSGFIREAGFTHSLTPARNCTFGCTYCYVPTMGVYGGLKPDDWKRWGQFTTFKQNAPALLRRGLRGEQSIYCSPLVDPYQPAEAEECAMPAILDALLASPPLVFTVQTRGPLILRDLDRLLALARRTTVRVSFSLTTNREEIRRLYEPHCAAFAERIRVIGVLRAAGIRVHATLAPLLPCDPDDLLDAALDATAEDVVGDPLHIRAIKPRGATTRDAARRISAHHNHDEWLEPRFQIDLVQRLRERARAAGRRFAAGPEGFSCLSQTY
jgi:DNA repair photolyase